MRRVLCGGLLLLAATAFAPAARAGGPTTASEVMRNLRKLQDKIAVGDAVAEAEYAGMMDRAARSFIAAPAAIWKDKRNARALISYLFSGGNAPDIAGAIARKSMPADLETLYAGALAYGLGNDTEARTTLLKIDATSVPTGLGGHLALVQATLTAETDKAKAITLLDLARLLEPGTLIEEAALRKEMSLIGATGDLTKFGLLTRRYQNAFPHSLYLDNFRQLVATSAFQLGSGNTGDEQKRLTTLLSALGPNERCRLLLRIAHDALIAGRLNMAAFASEQAGKLSPAAGGDQYRAMMYYGAATIVGDRYEVGTKALSAVDRKKLSKSDGQLRDSAMAIAEMIRGPVKAGKFDSEIGAAHATVLAAGERALDGSGDLMKSLSK